MDAENQNFYVNFGHAMWQWRTSCRLSPQDIATRMHIDVARYYAMERGQIEITVKDFLVFIDAIQQRKKRTFRSIWATIRAGAWARVRTRTFKFWRTIAAGLDALDD